jgi:hypothetical protein
MPPSSLLKGEGVSVEPYQSPGRKHGILLLFIVKKSAKNCTLNHVVDKSVWADIGAASTSSTNISNILVLLVLAAPIYWCYDVPSTNILVILVLAAPIGEDTQTFYNFKNFADF